MGINNEDLKKIGKIVESNIKSNNDLNYKNMDKMFRANIEIVLTEIDKIKADIASLKINDIHIKKELQRINDKIDQMMEMESEDFKSVVNDVEKLKEKLASMA